MASREQFLDNYEISRLLCDSDDSEDDRHSDDCIGLSGSKDEEDVVEEYLDDDIDSFYDVTDNGENGKLENTDDERSETGECTDKERNVIKARTLPGAGHLPKLLELTERT